MMTKRSRTNPLALAVLAFLDERSMHPYEIASAMRIRHLSDSIKLNYGSLYHVVASLLKARLIKTTETVREGRRPERVVYSITGAGRSELYDWLYELLSQSAKEYPKFGAGLTFLYLLPPAEAGRLLAARISHLEERVAEVQGIENLMREKDLPRVYAVEHEYARMSLEAELSWTRRLADDIQSGALVWEPLAQETGVHEELRKARS